MHATRHLLLALVAGGLPLAAQPTLPAASIQDVVVPEGGGPGGVATFTISLSAQPASVAVLEYRIEACTATDGADYHGSAGTFLFHPGGSLIRLLEVPLVDDAALEGVETFSVVLRSPSGLPLLRDRGEGVLLDDETCLACPLPEGDFDGDGRSDLWVLYTVLEPGEPGNRIIIWGVSGTVAEPIAVGAAFATAGWRVAAVADFDGDGEPDLLWRRDDGRVAVAPAGGDLTPPPVSGTDEPPGADPAAAVVGAADFDGDGEAEVLVRDPGGSLALWTFAGGSLQLAPPPDPAAEADPSWRAVATADFDRDGQPDILWRHLATGQLKVWSMHGHRRGGQLPISPALPGPAWQVAAAGDFNGDGDKDLLLQNIASSRLVVWFLEGSQKICGAYLSPSTLELDGEGGMWKVEGPK